MNTLSHLFFPKTISPPSSTPSTPSSASTDALVTPPSTSTVETVTPTQDSGEPENDDARPSSPVLVEVEVEVLDEKLKIEVEGEGEENEAEGEKKLLVKRALQYQVEEERRRRAWIVRLWWAMRALFTYLGLPRPLKRLTASSPSTAGPVSTNTTETTTVDATSSSSSPTIDIPPPSTSPSSTSSSSSSSTSLTLTTTSHSPPSHRSRHRYPSPSPSQTSLSLIPSSRPLLTPKTLVLDLDETLIHSTSKPFRGMKSAAGLKVRVVEVVLEGRSTVYTVYKRPWVDFFLRKVSTWYTVIIFTASLPEYADPVIDWLDGGDGGGGMVGGRLFRSDCRHSNGAYVKDLSVVDADLSRVCLVDNSPASYAINQANGIPIEGWINDPEDECLLDLLPMLDSLRFTTDVRRVLGLRGFGRRVMH